MRVPQELVTEGKLDKAEWPLVYRKKYPKSWWYHLKLCYHKKQMLLLRDKPYIKSQVIGAAVMGERTRGRQTGGSRPTTQRRRTNCVFLAVSSLATTCDALCRFGSSSVQPRERTRLNRQFEG